jgi:DNA-binding NarL/FixJ family response regulator
VGAPSSGALAVSESGHFSAFNRGKEYVLQAIRAGASGYLLKDAAVAELELALQAAVRGETYLSPRISKQVIQNYLERLGNQGTPIDQLTQRQREIVQLIAEGKSTKEIAFLLKVSVKTVEAHRAQLMDRLGIHDASFARVLRAFFLFSRQITLGRFHARLFFGLSNRG